VIAACIHDVVAEERQTLLHAILAALVRHVAGKDVKVAIAIEVGQRDLRAVGPAQADLFRHPHEAPFSWDLPVELEHVVVGIDTTTDQQVLPAIAIEVGKGRAEVALIPVRARVLAFELHAALEAIPLLGAEIGQHARDVRAASGPSVGVFAHNGIQVAIVVVVREADIKAVAVAAERELCAATLRVELLGIGAAAVLIAVKTALLPHLDEADPLSSSLTVVAPLLPVQVPLPPIGGAEEVRKPVVIPIRRGGAVGGLVSPASEQRARLRRDTSRGPIRLGQGVEDAVLLHHPQPLRHVVEATVAEPTIKSIWVRGEELQVPTPVPVPRTEKDIEAAVPVVVDEARAADRLLVLVGSERIVLALGRLLIEGREARLAVVDQDESRSLDHLARMLRCVARADEIQVAVIVDVARDGQMIGTPTANPALLGPVHEAPAPALVRGARDRSTRDACALLCASPD
jgi:hypothetical protein